ncbi:MAG: right-handed parallel beta-helix repeat-containing protein, partial [Myxococcota bacterium]
LLGACGGGGEVRPDDELGALTVTVSGLPVEATPIVTVAGPSGFSDVLVGTATLTDLDAGTYVVEAPPVTVGEDVYTSVVNPLSIAVDPGMLSTVLVAYATDGPPAPQITSVRIDGFGDSLQVRQGWGIFSLEITGTDLGGATIAGLGDLTYEIDANNATSAVVRFDAGDEVAPGPLDLELVVDAGTARLDEAIVVTETTVGGDGDDDTGRGTPDSPLRSIAAADAVAPAGADIVLLPGTYSEASGETWPLNVEQRRLIGSGAETTIVQGPGGGDNGLQLQGPASVVDLQITGFVAGVRALSGDIELEGLEVWGNTSDGFNASASTSTPVTSVSARDCVFRDNGLHGFEASTPADSPYPYELSNITSTNNGQRGIYLVQSVQMTLAGAVVEDNDFQGILLIQDARLDATDIVVRGNDLEGIEGTSNTTVILERAEVRGQQEYGIVFAGASLRIRDSEIRNNVGGGIRIAGEPVVDLGTVADPGMNSIGIDAAGISLGDYLFDDRSANRTPAISAVGVDVGSTPAASGLVTGVANDSPHWSISRVGNQIDFGP